MIREKSAKTLEGEQFNVIELKKNIVKDIIQNPYIL